MATIDLPALLISRQRVLESIGEILTAYGNGYMDAPEALAEVAILIEGPLKEGLPL